MFDSLIAWTIVQAMRRRPKETLTRETFEELEELEVLQSVANTKSDLPPTDEPASEDTVPNNTNDRS